MKHGFRVLGKEQKRYVFKDYRLHIDNKGRLYLDTGERLPTSKYAIELSTGLRCALTKVELYEGDIVKFREKVGYIKWDEHFLQFVLTVDHDELGEQFHRLCSVNEYKKVEYEDS